MVAGDILIGKRRQQMAVMNIVWPVTQLYMGLLGLWAYLALGRSGKSKPAQGDGRKNASPRPMWQSVFVATTHCGAGCALGDIVAEWGVFLGGIVILGSVLWANYIADFVLAYLLGIVFQYYSIVPMRHLKPAEGIKQAIKIDTLSITAFQVGMYAWMAVVYFVLFRAPHLRPNEASYWLMMQAAMLIGFTTSYPMNWWLVKSKIKEAM